MNILRQSLRTSLISRPLRRTVYIPPEQFTTPNSNIPPPIRQKPAPASPSFYTARPIYYDQVAALEKAIATTRTSLKNLHLLPLPDFARRSLPLLHPVWKTQSEMASDFQDKLTTTRYRRVTRLLNQLNDYQSIANTAGYVTFAEGISNITRLFESGNKEAMLSRGKRKKVVLDQYGRSYTVGKRKTSSARVWMIAIQEQKPELDPDSVEAVFGLDPSKYREPIVTPATILINNIPLNEYFPIPADRERVTRPLKAAGALGAYNVFALVRGGGTTGQSDALAQGIAKGIVAHIPSFEVPFRRSKLTRRDPRMVERKKTGLAKARKRYAWVKR